MRLKYQLFLSLLLSSGLLIVLMYAFNSWSFNRGFLNYLNTAEIQKLAPMIEKLAAGFEQTGSWNWLTDDLDTWDLLLEEYVGKRPSLRSQPPAARTELQQVPRPMDLVNARPPPPGRPGQQQSVLTFDAQLVLANTEKHILIGPPAMNPNEASRIWLPISLNETVSGYLGYRQIRELSGQIDKVFAAQQRSSFAYAALFMIVLSGVLAIVLAARIVRPVLKMNGAVSRISQGDYKHRIDSERLDEIGDLARNINKLATTLDQNLSARQQWLAEISHELRTPVAILQGELEAMIDGIIPVDDAAIASLHSESLRLSRLINDLHSLTLSDIGALDYHFQPLDLVSTVAARCHAASTLASSRDITVDLILPDKPLFMRGDQQRLEQLFDNLLQNSVRYTDPGGTLKVCMEARTECIDINWEDSSPGVTDEQLPHIFDVLYRAESSRNRSTGGAGLGLAIASRVVEAHEGQMSASQSDLGGLFDQYSISTPAGDIPMMIAIVEDEPKLARLMQGYLAQADFKTIIHSNGEDALEAIRNAPPDLVLLDLMLPGLDGLSVCRELRKISDLPIIMLTARVEEIDRLLGLEIGADDYICKPYSPREVVARVKAVLRRSQPTVEGADQDPSFCLDETRATVTIHGAHCELTRVELHLLKALHDKPGHILSREQLMHRIYSDNRIVSDRTIDSHVKKLRQKLNNLHADAEYVHSVYGIGYKFEMPATD